MVSSRAIRAKVDEKSGSVIMSSNKSGETEKTLGHASLVSEESLLQPEPLELDRLADLRQQIQDVSFATADGEQLTSHFDSLNTLLDVSANALGATTVDDLLQRVVDGARRVTGARLATAGYGYHSGTFEARATSGSEVRNAADERKVLGLEPREIALELMERRHSIRIAVDALPTGHRYAGGLIGARLVGREGAANGYILIFDKLEGDFTAEDEALISQLAVFTSLGLQHIQVRAEAETRFTEAEEGRSILSAIMEYVPEGITVAEGPDATIRMMSRYGRQMIGREPGELEGAPADEHPHRWRLFYLDGETRASWEELPLTRAIRSGETIIDEEWVLEDKEGQKNYALFNAGPIRNREGSVLGGIAVWRDITKRRSAEAELLAAKERLIRQEKLAYLGALAGGVGHELRTPLGSIKNAAYFLKMVVDDPIPEAREALDILEREVDSTESIITALLDFARPHPPERRDVELNSMLEEIVAKLYFSDAIELSWSLEPMQKVSADPGQLRQVLGNILVNAIQAMRDGGLLSIKTGLLPDSEVYISISDTGPGISPDHLKELFEPLFTTKARGIGLGLSVAQTLVQRHGGVIDVQSVPGQGSTFTVRLPVHDPEEG